MKCNIIMAVLVRCGHPFSAKEMLHLLQKKYGCVSVRTKGPEWYLLETEKGNFEINFSLAEIIFRSGQAHLMKADPG